VVVAADSPVPCAAPIGHSKVSHTFFPNLVAVAGIEGNAIDCPGFFDNRGAEINIANAVNIKAAAVRARGLVLVVLINYNSLLSDRARGLREVIETLVSLFDGAEHLSEHLDSVLLGVSQAPRTDGDGDPIELGHIQVSLESF